MFHGRSLWASALVVGIAAAGIATSSHLAIAQVTPPPTPKRVKVFFPKNPQQQKNMSYVEPVWRQTPNLGLAQFALEQLITGPTYSEKQQGFVTALQLRGASNCGRDFTLSITSGVARLKFCKDVPSAGIGDDARVKSSINATLTQFPSVQSVVILDRNGNCLADMSGDNRCLR